MACPASSTAVSDGTIAATLTPRTSRSPQLGQRAARAVAPRRGGVVLEALGRGHHARGAAPRERATTLPSPSAAIALTDDVPMSMPTVTSVPTRHSPVVFRCARERGHHVVVQQPVGRDHVTGVDARVAAHVGASPAGLLDHHLHRGDVPHREAADLDRDVDRSVGHEHVRPEVAEAAHPPAPTRQARGTRRRVPPTRTRRPSRTRGARPRCARTCDTDTASPSRRAPSPRAPDQRDPRAGRRHHPGHELAVDLERDERRPHRDAAGVALGAVDGVDDPASARARRRRRPVVPNSSPRMASSGRASARSGPDHLLDRPVGLGDRGEVGFGLHHQVGGPEAGHGDGVGRVGERVGQLEVGRGIGGEVGLGADARNVARTHTRLRAGSAPRAVRGRETGADGTALDPHRGARGGARGRGSVRRPARSATTTPTPIPRRAPPPRRRPRRHRRPAPRTTAADDHRRAGHHDHAPRRRAPPGPPDRAVTDTGPIRVAIDAGVSGATDADVAGVPAGGVRSVVGGGQPRRQARRAVRRGHRDRARRGGLVVDRRAGRHRTPGAARHRSR